jgi:alkylation response protein AidB-like acyl-CoA dehydrogenase
MTDAVRVAEGLIESLAGRAEGHDGDASFPAEDFADIRDAGLAGLMVPSELQGMGAGFTEYVQVAEALARGSASTALLFNMHASVTGALAGIPEEMARALGAADDFFETRRRVLADAARGAMYGVAITEPEAGSRLSQLRTAYRRTERGFHIEGFKSTVSGAGHLDGYLVAARDAEAPHDEPRITYFLVPASDGLRVRSDWDPLGMRATASNGMDIDVEVPGDALIGVEGIAVTLAYVMPQWLVASYAAVYVGVARSAVDAAASYVQGRTVAGRAGGLSALPAVRARLGRVEAAVSATRLVLRHAAELVDLRPGDPDTNRWVYRAKLLAGDVAQEGAASLAEACGLGALRRGQPLERILRDARMGALMPPSSDVSADYLGAAALGLDPQAAGVRPW